MSSAAAIADAEGAANAEFSSVASHSTNYPPAVTVPRYYQHEEHYYRASQINHMFSIHITKAMDWVTKEFGFNSWTRDLSDYEEAYAFVIPPELYYSESPKADKFRNTLNAWLHAVFNMHYIYIDVEWRESSYDTENSMQLYEVDWVGSRHRVINLGPHLYLQFRPRHTRSARPPIDAAPAAIVWPEGRPYKWSLVCEEPDQHTVNYKVLKPAEAAAAAGAEEVPYLEQVD